MLGGMVSSLYLLDSHSSHETLDLTECAVEKKKNITHLKIYYVNGCCL